MTSHRWSKRSRKPDEAGQAAVFVVLAMGLFLLGAVAFSVDMGNLWFHRQMAQGVADASCTAAAMDMLTSATGTGGAVGGFTPGTPFSCSDSPTAAPCDYATKNMGGAPSALTAGTPGYDVAFTFPPTVAGVPTSGTGTPPPSIFCDPTALANCFVQVNVDDRVQTYLAGLISGSRTMDVGAQATCAVVEANSPIPLLVLDPRSETSVTNNGNYRIVIVGGPQRSIQVDSRSATAINVDGSGIIDLRNGGPNDNGSDLGVTGPESQVTGFLTTSNGHWLKSAPAISDPFSGILAPVAPAGGTVEYNQTTASTLAAGLPDPAKWGCPDPANGCDHYHPGSYPAGIEVKKGKPTGTGATGLAVFDPGIYYLGGVGLTADSNSCLRPSIPGTAAAPTTGYGDGSGGTLFFFSGTATVHVTSNSGTLQQGPGSARTFDCQNVDTSTTPNTIINPAWAVSLDQVRCIPTGTTGATILPANVVSFGGLVGNVLLGPCHKPDPAFCTTNCSTNYGDPLGVDDPLGEQRGMLFFQDRSAGGVQPLWSGGGAFGLAGNLYFHYCSSTSTSTGNNCDKANAFTDLMELGGGSSSSTFVVGDIVTDQLFLHGNPDIEMDLNPNALYYVFKATLVQ